MPRIKVPSRYQVVLDSPLGRLGVQHHHKRLIRLDYLPGNASLKPPATPFERQLASQLARYFANPGQHFTVSLDLQGTAFQHRVWDILQQIPAGETLTYGALAARLGSGARAVGNACRNNPVSIIVPCHRVVSAAGIGGYSGKTDGAAIVRKQWLLKHEGIGTQDLKFTPKPPTTRLHTSKQRNLHG